MSLRNRLFFTLLFIFTVYICIIYGSVRYFLFSDFELIEKEEASKNLLRGLQYLEDKVIHLKILWDNDDRREHYVRAIENQDTDALRHNMSEDELDEVFYWVSEKGPFYHIDMSAPRLIEKVPAEKSAPEEFASLLQLMPATGEHNPFSITESTSRGGLWNTPNVIRLLAGKWVKTSSSPPTGSLLLLSRQISDDLVGEFRIRTHVRLNYWNPLSPYLPAIVRLAEKKLTKQNTSFESENKEKNVINLYTTVHDISGTKIGLILEAEIPKDITKEGSRTMWVIFWITLLSGPFSFLIMAILVQVIGRH